MSCFLEHRLSLPVTFPAMPMPLSNLITTDVKTGSRIGDKVSTPWNALGSSVDSFSQYLVEIPRGCSVHVFKTPSPPAYTQPGTMPKSEYQGRTPSPGSKQLTYPSRPDPSRKPSLGRATDYFGDQVLDYDRSRLDLTRTTSKPQKPYSIYPSAIPDTYIYERSISSTSDLPGSPGSSSSSDTDSIDTPIERCSIRARSSVETLEATLYAAPEAQISPSATSPYSAFYSSAPLISTGRPVVVPPLSLTSKKYQPTVDDDASTLVSEHDQPRNTRPTAIYSTSNTPAAPAPVVPLVVPPTPSRRNSDERSSSSNSRVQIAPPLSRRESTQQVTSKTSSPTAYVGDTSSSSVRLPPGLQYTNPAPVMGSSMSRRSSNSTSSAGSGAQRSPTSDQPLVSRTVSGIEVQVPQRRCVRFTENLICPSPVPRSERRKGWWNRRG